MTLRARLALGLAIFALALIVPIFVSRRAMDRLRTEVSGLRDQEFRESLELGKLRDVMGDLRARELSLGVLKDDTTRAQLQASLRDAHGIADSLAIAFQDSSARRISGGLNVVEALVEGEYRAWREGRGTEGDSISLNATHDALYDTERSLALTERLLGARTTRRVTDVETELERAEDVSIAALAVAVVVAALIAFWLTRSISGPVQALERGMRAVAGGELDHRLDLSTERRDEFGRLAESFRQMSQQLAELDQLKAEFVSVASHELKTPINVILGYLQLMQDGIYGPLAPKQAEVLGTVESQGRTLARLASHLLDVTRFEAGGGRIEPRPVHLESMLNELERAFHVLAVQRGVTFHVTLDADLPAEAHWDVDRINEVLGNLLANAFKFTPEGGLVELIAAASADDKVRFIARDTGAGIPPEHLPHIFEKFFQADNQGAASAPGTGLGLAIAKEIVEAHRGTIACESTLGEGTTFTLLLPVTVGNRRRTGSHRIVQLEAVS